MTAPKTLVHVATCKDERDTAMSNLAYTISCPAENTDEAFAKHSAPLIILKNNSECVSA